MAVKFALVLAVLALVEIQSGLAADVAHGLSLGSTKAPGGEVTTGDKDRHPELPIVIHPTIEHLGDSREKKEEKNLSGEINSSPPARVARADRYRRDHHEGHHGSSSDDHPVTSQPAGQKPQGQDGHEGHDHGGEHKDH